MARMSAPAIGTVASIVKMIAFTIRIGVPVIRSLAHVIKATALVTKSPNKGGEGYGIFL